jgi:hypothetical protein
MPDEVSRAAYREVSTRTQEPHSPRTRDPGAAARRWALAVAAVAGTLTILSGPAAFSAANLTRALNGNNVIAGPASARTMGGPGGGTPPSGAMGGGSVSSALISYLQANQGAAKYLVAITGSQASAGIIIQTGEPVVTIGGFNGGDPAPTTAQLAQMVADGQLKYVLLGSGMGGGPGGGNSSSELAAWVKAHGKAVTSVETGSQTLYELSA